MVPDLPGDNASCAQGTVWLLNPCAGIDADKQRNGEIGVSCCSRGPEQTTEIRVFVKKIEDETGKKAVTTASGLAYIDLTDGDGATPEKTDRVEVHYTGWLLDGSKFDSSVDKDKPFAFSLRGGVIKGWLEGVATMKVGGKRKLIIPPELGYGKRGSGAKIPPDSVLVFDVELLRIISGG